MANTSLNLFRSKNGVFCSLCNTEFAQKYYIEQHVNGANRLKRKSFNPGPSDPKITSGLYTNATWFSFDPVKTIVDEDTNATDTTSWVKMALSIFKHCVKTGSNLSNRGVVFEGVLKTATKNMKCRCICLAPINFAKQISLRDYSSKHHKHVHAERKYDTSSESDSDLEWIGHRGESDFWRRKIRTFHGILDLNKDGVISFDDFKILSDRFINLGHLKAEQVKKFQTTLKDLWEKQFGEITPYNLVTVEKYLENMHHVLNDKRLVRKAHSFLPYLFKAVDKDRSGEITLEEFKLFYDVLGLIDQDAILAFRAIDSNGDGKISQKEFVRHGRDFFLTEDEDRISKYFWGPLVDH